MIGDRLARNVLWDVAETQHGFIAAKQAAGIGIDKHSLQMLVARGTVERAAFGVYRFPQFPVSEYDQFMLAVLWTRVAEACLSHETALAAYEISDINPNVVHVTVPARRRLRRANPQGYVIHHEDLTADQIGWWQEIPTATPATAVAQCIACGTPTYLLRQALERGHSDGYLTSENRDRLSQALEARHAR